MAKDNVTQVERLLDLVPYLISHQGISITELAKAFNVTVKEITRDLNTLWMCGLPGYTPLELIDLEFESGFVTIRNAETLKSPRSLTKIEALSLLLGLDILEKDGVDINALKERVSSVLGNAVAISISSQSDSKIRGALSQALNQKKSIEIEYHSIRTDSVTKRVATPIELIIDNGREYLLAYCHLSHSHRSFRVDRISSAEIFGDAIAPSVFRSESEQFEISLEIRKPSRAIQERLALSDRDSLSPHLTIQVYSQEWALRTIMAGAGSLVLQAPSELRQQVKERATRALALYA